MNYESDLVISESDYLKIKKLISTNRSTATMELLSKLTRCEIAKDEDTPTTVVRLFKEVLYQEIATGNTRKVSIVMPWESDVIKMRVSILSPVGIALLGTSIGDTVCWPLLHGKSLLLKVVSVDLPQQDYSESIKYVY